MTDILDDDAAQAKLDPGGMLASVRDLPRQCRAAWQEAQALDLPPSYRDVDKVVVLGMGGSAIAGDFLRSLLALESRVPVFNHRQYGLPPYVDDRTLLVASSYSGNTEETLSAFEESLRTGAKKLVITTGGRLLATARANGVPAFVFEYRSEPRAALGYSLMPLLAVAEKAGLMRDVGRDVDEALAVIEDDRKRIDAAVPADRNPAKQLTRKLHGRLPVIYGAGILTEAAHRWKTQLNESSKVWCFYEELPEADHNAIVGYGLPEEIAQRTFAVFLRSDGLHARVALRYEFTQRALKDAGVPFDEVKPSGRSALAQILSAVLFGDYVSYYLAVLNGVDPTPTTIIDDLKAWLADR
ncbi:MAG: bifunctional phosphoglucose/phosphomannose isomerase [Chloroflexi bacterium]|nr:bifunctional phosphoglucose/phosphomannose isomerase [Chloroflexota bacterium]